MEYEWLSGQGKWRCECGITTRDRQDHDSYHAVWDPRGRFRLIEDVNLTEMDELAIRRLIRAANRGELIMVTTPARTRLYWRPVASLDDLDRDEQLKAMVLREVTKDPGLTARELGARLWATSADISRAIEDLCDEGLLREDNGGFWIT